MTYATQQPTANSVPKANANAKIDPGWLPTEISSLSVTGTLQIPIGSALPTSANNGEVFFVSTTNTLYVRNGSTWHQIGGSSSSSGTVILDSGSQTQPSLRFADQPDLGIYLRPLDTTTEITGSYWNYTNTSNSLTISLNSGSFHQDVVRIYSTRDRRTSDSELWWCGRVEVGEPELGTSIILGAKPRTTTTEKFSSFIVFTRFNNVTNTSEPGFSLYQGSGGNSCSLQVRCLDKPLNTPGDLDIPLSFEYSTTGWARIAYSGQRAVSIGTATAWPGTISLGGVNTPSTTPSASLSVLGNGFFWIGRALRVETENGFVQIGERTSGNRIRILKANTWNNAQLQFCTSNSGNQRGAIELGSDDQLTIVGGWNSGDYVKFLVGSGLQEPLRIYRERVVVGQSAPTSLVLTPVSSLPSSPVAGEIVNLNGTLRFYDGNNWRTINLT